MTNHQQILGYYASPGSMTVSGKYAGELKKLPDDIISLMHIVQGLVIHEYMANAYGVSIAQDRKEESHIRYFTQMLDTLFAIDKQELKVARPPEKRLVGVCHHFAVLLAGLLRAKGIPARSRYGFGDYFNPGFFEDHSLCEYWNAKYKRWIMVDPQFDDVWQKELHIKHNVFDVPADRFLIAGDAWMKCRKGEADPSKFGIFKGELRGLWFIAGNIVKDIAALNKMELLQWDVWGAMPRPNSTMRDNMSLRFFDELAAFTHEPDASFDELHALYEDKEKRLLVPEKVFNAMRKHLEKV